MVRSLPLAECSASHRRYSILASTGSRNATCRHLSPGTCHRAGSAGSAFTLIELLVVVAIIAILAALTLSTLGYVNKKGAESRARAEVAALSAAIESFKLDTGLYPSNAATLYTNLCPPATAASAKVYFEPTPQMLLTNSGVVQFADPWGTAYGYSNFTTYFEIWSTAGAANSNNWIRN
jgi:general secretion pathway protein G